MWRTLLTVVFLTGRIIKGEDGSPMIKVKPCIETDALSHDICMSIMFGNGVEDVMLLKNYMEGDSVLVGYLKKDPHVSVYVSKEIEGDWEGQPFLAIFHSKNEPHCGTFNVTEDGMAVCSENHADGRKSQETFLSDYEHLLVEDNLKQLHFPLLSSNKDRQQLPTLYRMKMAVFVDKFFVKNSGTCKAGLKTIKTIIGMAASVFSLPSSPLKLEIKIEKITYLPGNHFTPTEKGLIDVEKHAFYGPEADSYMFLSHNSFQQVKFGGRGYVGVTCGDKWFRVAVVIHTGNDTETGMAVAHELGHNLGMDHDFDDITGNPRNASDGTQCTGVKGIMDYGDHRTLWTKCSHEDWDKYFKANQPFCLKKI